jgi:hypothetical protein
MFMGIVMSNGYFSYLVAGQWSHWVARTRASTLSSFFKKPAVSHDCRQVESTVPKRNFLQHFPFVSEPSHKFLMWKYRNWGIGFYCRKYASTQAVFAVSAPF